MVDTILTGVITVLYCERRYVAAAVLVDLESYGIVGIGRVDKEKPTPGLLSYVTVSEA